MINERWYSLSIEDAEKKLNTNISSGLDIKEAERRRRRGDGGSIYTQVTQSPLIHASKIAADIMVILFVLAASISAFFDNGKTAVTAAVLALASLFVSIVCYAVSKHRFEQFAEYSLPRARVIRSGKIFFVDCSDVVLGDIILLEKGDIVPCDCRLISSEGMRAIEFVGKVAGKEKKMLTEKDAFYLPKAEEKPGVAEQKNMIGAASVVSAGRGKAIAVRTGKKTFISLMLGNLEAFSSQKREAKLLNEFSRLLSRFTLAVLIATIPVSIIAMIVGGKNIGIFDILLILFAVAVTSGSEIITGIAYLFYSDAMKKTDKKSGGIIKYPDALQEMNYVDSVMIFSNKSLCCEEKNVESAFAANRFYEASTAKNSNDAAINCFIDLALLGTSAYFDIGSNRLSPELSNDFKNAKAIAEFAADVGIERTKLFEGYSLVEFSERKNSGVDTSLIKNGEEYRVICVSESSDILSLCSHIRTPEGALPLENDKKSDIVRAIKQLNKNAKSVTLIASRVSPCSSLSRLGVLQNQLIFEGYIVYSAPYAGSIAENIMKMNDAEISVYYISDENADSVITAFNIGVVKGKSEIAYASLFNRSSKDILDNFGQYRAYLGFNAKDLDRLTRHIKGDDGTVAVIASDTEHISAMNSASVSVSVADISTSEIARKNADVLVNAPQKVGGGFSAFADAVINSKNACTALSRFYKYLSFATAMRLFLAIIPLLFGSLVLTAVQIIFLGAFIDIPVMICLAKGKHSTEFSDRIADVETMLGAPIKSSAKYIASGAALGAIMLMLTAVFGSSNIATGSFLSVFALMGTSISQLFAFFIIARVDNSSGFIKKAFFLLFALIVLIMSLGMIFPVFGAFFGVFYPGWQICAAAPLVSVIGYVMLIVTDRYI